MQIEGILWDTCSGSDERLHRYYATTTTTSGSSGRCCSNNANKPVGDWFAR